MKGVPNRDEEGEILLEKSESTFSQVIVQFLSCPDDIVNNRLLKKMEQSLELTLSYDSPSQPTKQV
jgi:hypothetical protein